MEVSQHLIVRFRILLPAKRLLGLRTEALLTANAVTVIQNLTAFFCIIVTEDMIILIILLIIIIIMIRMIISKMISKPGRRVPYGAVFGDFMIVRMLYANYPNN